MAGAEVDPFPEIDIEPTPEGLEKAKDNGNKLFSAGSVDGSVRWFSKCLWLLETGKVARKDDRLSAVLHKNRAFAYQKLGRWQEAESDCTVALELQPEDVKALYRRALARMELGKAAQALKDAETALRQQPDIAELQALCEQARATMAKEASASTAPAPGFRRMQIVEAEDDSDEEVPPAPSAPTQREAVAPASPAVPTASPPSAQAGTTKAHEAPGPEPGFRRMQIVEASDSEPEDESTSKKAPVANGDPPASGFRRMEIVEADDDSEDEVPIPVKVAQTGGAREADPFPDIVVEPTLEGLEKAKDRGNKLFSEGSAGEAARWFSKCLWLLQTGTAAGSDSRLPAILHKNRAFAYQKLERWQDAESDCTAALGLQPQDVKALYRRAVARMGLANPAEALQDAEAALQQQPDLAELQAICDQARAALAPKSTPPAAVPPPAAAPAQPEAPAGFRRMEIVEVSDSESEPEVSSASKAAQAKPAGEVDPFPDIVVEPTLEGLEKAKDRGNKFFAEGATKEAVRWFSKSLWMLQTGKAVSKDGRLPAILHKNRAFAYQKLEQWQDAENDCTAALELQPEDVKALYRRGVARMGLNKPGEALQDAAAALRLQPGLAEVQALHDQAKAAAAPPPAAVLGQATEAEASKPEPGFRRMQIVEASDSEEEEVPAAVKVAPAEKGGEVDPFPDIVVDPTAAGLEAAKVTGNKLFSEGSAEEAVRWFSKCLWLHRSGKVRGMDQNLLAILHKNRAYAYQKLERWQDAESDCTAALDLQPEDVKALYRRAVARMGLGKPAQALQDAEAALRQQPGMPELQAIAVQARAASEPTRADPPATPPAVPAPPGLSAPKTAAAAGDPPATSFRRMQIVEADDDSEDEVPMPVKAEQGATMGEAEPFPDIVLEATLEALEKAKDTGNKLFADGSVNEALKWFSKCIWIFQTGKAAKGDTLLAILHKNRAFVFQKLERWQDAEDDCTAALDLQPEDLKALYRRAVARMALGKAAEALEDAEAALRRQPGMTELQALSDQARAILASKKPAPAAPATPPPAPAPPTPAAAAPAAGFRRMQIVEAEDDESDEGPPAKPSDAKPRAAPPPETHIQDPKPEPGFRRMQIVEASDSEAEDLGTENLAAVADGPGPPSPATPSESVPEQTSRPAAPVEADPFPDVAVDPTPEGLEKAKDTGNKLFSEGSVDSAVRWFSKCIWLFQVGKVTGTDSRLLAILHKNRAFAYHKLERWQDAESDCSVALELQPEDVKALYRRAVARMALARPAEALQDAERALRQQPDSAELQALCEQAKTTLAAKVVVTPPPPAPQASTSTPPAPGFRRMQIVEADDDESDDAPEGAKSDAAVPPSPAAAPKAASPAGGAEAPPSGEPPATGFRRMQIVEADDDSEDEAVVPAPIKPADTDSVGEADPFPDIAVEPTLESLENAKDKGNKLFSEGSVNEAVRCFSKCLWMFQTGKVASKDTRLLAVLHKNRAFAYQKLERWQDAENDCTAALHMQPEDVKALYRRALARMGLGKPAEALEDGEAALRQQPDMPELQALCTQARAALAAAAPAPKAALPTAQVVANGHSPPATVREPQAEADPFPDIVVEQTLKGLEEAKDQGNQFFASGKTDEAVRWFSKCLWLLQSRRIVAADNNLPAILHKNRAFAYQRLERWQDAEQDCSVALGLQPEDMKALYRRALARLELGRPAEALEDIQSALRQHPDKPELQALRDRATAAVQARTGAAGPAPVPVPPVVPQPQPSASPAARPAGSPPADTSSVPQPKPSASAAPVAASIAPAVVTNANSVPSSSTSPASSQRTPVQRRAPAVVQAVLGAPTVPASNPKNSFELLRNFSSMKRHPSVLACYLRERVPATLLQSLFSRAPIEADDLATVLAALQTSRQEAAEFGEEAAADYVRALLRTKSADTQFRMLSRAERAMLEDLLSGLPADAPLRRELRTVAG